MAPPIGHTDDAHEGLAGKGIRLIGLDLDVQARFSGRFDLYLALCHVVGRIAIADQGHHAVGSLPCTVGQGAAGRGHAIG